MAIASVARSVLLAPWRAASLATGTQSFHGKPTLGGEASNRRGLHARRVAIAARMAERRRARLRAVRLQAEAGRPAARGPALRPSIRVESGAMERRTPFLPWTGPDLWAIPGLRERREALQRRVPDLMECPGLRGSTSRRLPPSRPAEEHA